MKTTRVIVGAAVALSWTASAVMAQQADAVKPQETLKGPIKVFILAGQSNMEGQGSVDHDYNGGKGTLVWAMKNSKSAEKMKCLKNEKGEWVVRDDVRFRKAQEEGTKQIKNALFIKTADFARPAELSPCPTHGHHWNANAESYFLIGEAAGEGMKSLLKK